jgi:hypothetical protein
MRLIQPNSTYQRHDFLESPDVICQSGFHCWRDAERLVNAAEVVEHEVNRGGVLVVLQLFAEGVGEPCKAAVAHAQREILAFNVTRADGLSAGLFKVAHYPVLESRQSRSFLDQSSG